MTRTLRLTRETLATLTDDELAGGTPTLDCTGYGCPPWAFRTLPLRACLPVRD